MCLDRLLFGGGNMERVPGLYAAIGGGGDIASRAALSKLCRYAWVCCPALAAPIAKLGMAECPRSVQPGPAWGRCRTGGTPGRAWQLRIGYRAAVVQAIGESLLWGLAHAPVAVERRLGRCRGGTLLIPGSLLEGSPWPRERPSWSSRRD